MIFFTSQMSAERKYRINVGSLLYRHLYSHLEIHRGVFAQARNIDS